MNNWKLKTQRSQFYRTKDCTLESIVKGLDNLIKKMLPFKKIPRESLIPWVKSSKSNPILKQIDVISCLEALEGSSFLFLLIKHWTMLLLCVKSIKLKWYWME